jgi:hypothetical protein
MGVMATYCQLCGLPVQHDHYVPKGGMFEIYRSDSRERGPDGPEPVFAFGPEHDWLHQAVALALDPDAEPALLEGAVTDGWLRTNDDADEQAMVLDGIDDWAALHRACYELAQQPPWWSPGTDLGEIAALVPYREQLFDFAALRRDGLDWMLTDPRGESHASQRSRRRIDERVAKYQDQR